MSAPSSLSSPSRWWAWLGLIGVGVLLLGGALSPPLLGPEMRAAVRRGFAPVCHQMPGRSPHIGGVVLAVCDRCLGIYTGLLAGTMGAPWGSALWQGRRTARWVLLGGLSVLAIDWGGPVLGLWASTPLSRGLTGAMFGVLAAHLTATQILCAVGRR
jgi:uncharacterized membrane protein